MRVGVTIKKLQFDRDEAAGLAGETGPPRRGVKARPPRGGRVRLRLRVRVRVRKLR